MKSFSQFVQESYLNEGVSPSERPARRRSSGPSPEEVKAQIDAREAEKAQRRAQRKPSGAAARPDLQFKKSTVQSPATPSTPTAQSSGSYRNPRLSPTSRVQTTASSPGTSTQSTSTPYSNPNIASRKPGESIQDLAARRQAATRSRISRSSEIVPAGRQSSSAIVPTGKPPVGPKPTSKFGKVGKFGKALGPAATALDVALSTADERAKGSGWKRSLAKGAAVAAGGLAGGALGAIGGGGIGSAALGTAGAIGGAEAAGKAFDVAAGANAKERAAMARKNRQRQAGSAIKGIGGKTTFDTKKNTMTTGTGAQRKTVKLGKTGVVQRGGKSVAGHLAYKDGKAVYKAGPSAQSLAKTSSNPLERIGRTLFAGAYKKHDAAKAKQALQKARQSDASRNKALGVKFKPGG
jgi:hypothetical protein